MTTGSASAAVQTPSPTQASTLERTVERVGQRKRDWARLPIGERRALLGRVRRALGDVAKGWVDAACAARGVAEGDPLRGEEWISGPMVTARIARQLENALRDIARVGRPVIARSQLSHLPDGRLAVKVYPQNRLDSMLLLGHTAEVHLQAGITEGNLSEHQASFYRRPHEGQLCAVLGAGNINAIPPTDCLQKLFVDGTVCVLKMNPVNAYLGPFLERMFAPLIERGYFAVVYGGAEEGAQLVRHPLVDEIHITGSDKTYDVLMWGPPGPEADARRASGQPLLGKRISSELGNITPVVVVPGPYGPGELVFQGRNIAGMVGYNASFNCNSAKLLVTPKGASFRRPLLDHVETTLAQMPPRFAWYPGASERWKAFTEGRPNVKVLGDAAPGALPWAVIEDVDASRTDDRVFRQEPWCALLSETALPGETPEAFLSAMTDFLNTKVWGTLCVSLIVHPDTLASPSSREAVERAIRELKYGTVAVNTWPGAGFALGSTPWGGHPSATVTDIQSGLGIVHNTLMLEGVEKTVLRAPLRAFPYPPWWPGLRTLEQLGETLFDFEQRPSWRKLPKLAGVAAMGTIAAVRG